MAQFTFSAVPQFNAEVSLTVPIVTASGVAVDQTFTVNGLQTWMTVVVNPTSDLPTDVNIGSAYVSAANTLKMRFVKATAGASTATAVTFKILGL